IRKQLSRRSKKLFSSIGLKSHELQKSVIVDMGAQRLFRVSKTREVLLRQINSTVLQILPDIAQNIRHLQSQTELDGVLTAVGISITKNFDTHQSDCACNPVTINPQFLKSSVPRNGQVHFHPDDNLFQHLWS